MASTAQFPTSPVAEPAQPEDKFRQEQWTFYCLLGELLKTHKGQFAAVCDGRLVDIGPNRMELIQRVREKHGDVPIYVGLVSDQPPPIERVPRFRFIR